MADRALFSRGLTASLGGGALSVLFGVAVASSVLAQNAAPSGAGPVFSAGGPDAEDLGAAQGYPVGNRLTTTQQRYLVGAYSHFDELFSSHLVGRSVHPWSFKRSAKEPEIRVYNRKSLVDYLADNPATGLLIAKDDTILFEHYQYGRTDRDRLLSQSMAKTIIAMLIGIAIADHAIASVDDPVATYVPGLAGTEYGKTPIRDLLHMSSGVRFEEKYDGQDDISRLAKDLFGRPGRPTVEAVAQFNTRIALPGTKFHYASIETEILGLVLKAAVKKPIADYLREKIWDPIGAEADASWVIDGSGQEVAFCCFNAVLRDYARLGRLLAHDGAWDGRQLIPRQWIIDGTTVRERDGYLAPGHLMPGFPLGYGYQVWLLRGERRMFVLLGIRGQALFVDPATKLVMVHTAVRENATGLAQFTAIMDLWEAVVDQLGRAGR